jgi:outer membrane receptor protein involved in Fe transport
MTRISSIKAAALCGACTILLSAAAASARDFNIPSGDLEAALDSYTAQTGVALIVSNEAIHGIRTKGVQGDLSADDALTRLLSGTGFTTRRTQAGAVGVVRDLSQRSELSLGGTIELAQLSRGSSIETVTVTSSKLGSADVQSIPIAVTALSDEQLRAQKIEGGPDLLKSVPNMSFTKTNFTSYNIQIRGIGTQAVSVATDPAVAVAFNDTPFIRNHFFEQEFFDVAQVEVLRGPQGTLYGRNATGGVVNISSAKPTDQFEGQIKGEVGNYNSKRLSGFLNVPILDDKLGIRLAGALTDRKGYDYNETTKDRVNGRKLWSTRTTLSAQPIPQLHADLIWEHFDENDDRSRTGKQLCHRDDGPQNLGDITNLDPLARGALSTGCKAGSLYDADAFGTPNGLSIGFILVATPFGFGNLAYDRPPILPDGSFDPNAKTTGAINTVDPYGGLKQSPDLRTIASIRDPKYRAQNDTIEFNASFQITPQLTLASQTGYNHDQLYSFQDYNRFNTVPIFNDSSKFYDASFDPDTFQFVNSPSKWQPLTPGGIFCDPQIGCSSSIAGFDISQEHATQFAQELRLTSSYEGRFNFSIGANYTHYHTVEDYYVMYNLFTLFSESFANGYPSATQCISPTNGGDPVTNGGPGSEGCIYIDPNPVDQINGQGHNYYRSQNPYTLNSWAGFGEAYYQLTDDVKLTGGLRFTSDRKTFTPIPTQLILSSFILTGGLVDKGYPADPDIRQSWGEITGRAGLNWTPKVSWSDQTMVYAFYSRGYKAGGANPPGIAFNTEPLFEGGPSLITPIASYASTFKPEFVNAFELGSKNTLLDGILTLNADGFFYDYKNYQLSKIVDRTAINENFDAEIWGAELEAVWEPVPGLRFNFSGGAQDSSLGDGSKSIDLMDRTDGNPNYLTVKPFPVLPSNCVVAKSEVEALIASNRAANGGQPGNDIGNVYTLCPGFIFSAPPGTYDTPNQGQGFYKDLSGKELPNTPHFTVSFGGQYAFPLSENWGALLRTDVYWQSNSWARVYNDRPYDVLHGWSNMNLTVDLIHNDGLQIEAYIKNVFNTTALTGAFLNSDDSALTTNVFVTDPRLIGFSITKNF